MNDCVLVFGQVPFAAHDYTAIEGTFVHLRSTTTPQLIQHPVKLVFSQVTDLSKRIDRMRKSVIEVCQGS
jgi:hypothetical protein